MRWLLASGSALALAVVSVAVVAGDPAAQAASRVLDACGPGKQEIRALDLPEAVGPEGCPLGGRTIVDGAVESVVPDPGRGIHAEVLTTSGAQELVVERLPDGTVELGHVGDDSGPVDEGPATADPRAAGGVGCGDPAYSDLGHRVEGRLSYRINGRTIASELSRPAAITAVRRAGANVADTRNGCRMGDRNPSGMAYEGRTSRYPDRRDGSCTPSDGVSVVGFGDLPSSSTLAVTCTYYSIRPGYDKVTSSDVKINKTDFQWTTGPDARSCEKGWDLQSVVTHERGHTFGLGHVLEGSHGNLTMSTAVNGPCQSSERSLGRGDVRGIDGKYP